MSRPSSCSSAVWVAQTTSVAGSVEANVARHVACLREVKRAGGGVVVFPELSLTGYEPGRAAELALSPRDPRLEPIAEAVRGSSVAAVVGLPIARDGARPWLGSLVFDGLDSRRMYAKVHLGAFAPADIPAGRSLPVGEPEVFAPGETERVYELNGVPSGLAICADGGRTQHVACAKQDGAERYLLGAFALPGDIGREHGRLSSAAREHGLLVALANHGGDTGDLPSGGRSAIWSASGELLVELPPAPSELLLGVAEPLEEGWRGRIVQVPAP